MMHSRVDEPSAVWHQWLNDLSFLDDVHAQSLRMLFGFGYYLGAPIEKDLWVVNRQLSDNCESNLVHDYYNIIGDDTTLHLSELDPKRERFSSLTTYHKKELWINTDIVRMQVDASNIERFGLSHAQSICEVGGGYGQLALGFLNHDPNISYTIIDFPFIMNTMRRWISYLNLEFSLYEYDSLKDYEYGRHRPGLHLLPNTLIDLSSPLSFELLININSFCEMTERQVLDYLNFLKFDFMYTNNRDRQPNNSELNSLCTLFDQYGKLHPTPNEYAEGLYEKAVYIVSKLDTFHRLPINKIKGVAGTAMPSLSV